MKCFIDFDDTLLHTSRMREEIFSAFSSVPANELKDHYDAFRKEQPFTIAGFTDYLQNLGLDGEALRALFYAHAARAEEYVFEDAVDFLRAMKEAGHQLSLLTFAVELEGWQTPKIEQSGLVPLLDAVHVTSGKKADVIRALNISEPFVFIDDKASEVEAMQAAFPNALCLKHEPGLPLSRYFDMIERRSSTLSSPQPPDPSHVVSE